MSLLTIDTQTSKMEERQKQIIRQSSMKTAVDYFKVRTDLKPTLMEVLGVCMGIEAYATNGEYDLLKKVQEKLDKQESPKQSEYSSIEEALESYWDESRNPNGSYDIDYSLQENERTFCESEGFLWEEWENEKQRKNSSHFQ
jgi:hypothetical protein